MNPNGETEQSLNRELGLLSEDGEDNESMPAEPVPEVESEPLAPPKQENIPGTDIPDEGRPEYETQRPGSYDPNKDMDPEFEIEPPSVDTRMPIIHPNSIIGRNGRYI